MEISTASDPNRRGKLWMPVSHSAYARPAGAVPTIDEDKKT